MANKQQAITKDMAIYFIGFDILRMLYAHYRKQWISREPPCLQITLFAVSTAAAHDAFQAHGVRGFCPEPQEQALGKQPMLSYGLICFLKAIEFEHYIKIKLVANNQNII
jgi:hypothetical protein